MKTIGLLNKDKIWLDNSSLSLVKTCPRQYFLRVEQQIAIAATSSALSTGSACHDAKATYLKAKMAGHPHEICLDVAMLVLSKAMLAIPNPDDIRNETVVSRVMRSYFDRWQNELYLTHEVEVGFAIDLDQFIWVGKIDAVKSLPAFGTLIEETKTTTVVGNRWPLRTKPNNQIDGYVSAWFINTGEMPYGAILDIIPLFDEVKVKDKKSVEARRPFRLITVRSERDVDNWIVNTKEWFRILSMYKETNIWPQNTDACAPLVGFSCDYINICQEYPSVTSVQSMNISSDFKIEEWEPWEITKAKNQQDMNID